MTGKDALAMRRRLGLSQALFWNRIGVTQSAGSRYETGTRRLWTPIQMLIEIAHGTKAKRVFNGLRRAVKAN